MEGQVADINANFFDEGDVVTGKDGGEMTLDYSDTPAPPIHCNCVCTLIPITYTVDEAKKNDAPLFRLIN